MSLIISYSDSPVIEECLPSIFLAGPTRRNGRTEWREKACSILEDNGFGGIVYIPEYEKGKFDSSQLIKQCLWERKGLELADCILFWVPRYIANEMPAFTTNVEFGTYLQRKPEQVVYGHPVDADKMAYMDWLYQYEKSPEANIYSTLNQTVIAAQKVAEWHFEK